MSNITFSEQIAERAREAVTNPYLYGCTNFTCAVLAGAGAGGVRANATIESLDTDTIGPAVNLDKVESGDLIFFTENLDRSGRSPDNADRYVGIVDIDPDGKLWVIHQTGTGPSSKIQRVPIDAIAGPQPGGFGGALPSVDDTYQALGFRRVLETATTSDTNTLYYGPQGEKVSGGGAPTRAVPAGAAGATAQPANPVSVSHRVKDGDTIRSIAREHGIRMSELIDSNPILRDFAPIAGLELEIPTAPAPPTTPAEESPPGELYIPPGGSLPGTDGPDGEFFLDQVALAKYIYENLPNELIGYGQTGTKPIQDGAIYGLHAGSRKEWTRFFMALISKESNFDMKESGDDGRFGGDGFLPGSHGPLQLSHRDLVNYKLPNITGTVDEIRAKLQDPKFNLALGFKIMTDLMTGRADATEGINVTRIGYSNPTNASIAPAGPNSTYERSAGPGKYWSPLRGAFFDKDDPTVRISDDVNNISAESFTNAEASLLAALEIIKAEADQASQAEGEETPNPSPEPQQRRDSARTSSGNRSNQQQNQNARRDSLKQPAPVQNELLYNNNTVFNFPGGDMSFGGGDFEEELQFNSANPSGNSSLSLGRNIKDFTTGDKYTLSNNQFNTAKGTANYSSTSTINRFEEGVETRTGDLNYGGWEDLKEAMAGLAAERARFDGDLTDGPSLQDPMEYSLGYHLPGLDDSRNVENPNLGAGDLSSTEVLKGQDLPEPPEVPTLDTAVVSPEGVRLIPGTGSPGAPGIVKLPPLDPAMKALLDRGLASPQFQREDD